MLSARVLFLLVAHAARTVSTSALEGAEAEPQPQARNLRSNHAVEHHFSIGGPFAKIASVIKQEPPKTTPKPTPTALCPIKAVMTPLVTSPPTTKPVNTYITSGPIEEKLIEWREPETMPPPVKKPEVVVVTAKPVVELTKQPEWLAALYEPAGKTEAAKPAVVVSHLEPATPYFELIEEPWVEEEMAAPQKLPDIVEWERAMILEYGQAKTKPSGPRKLSTSRGRLKLQIQ